MVTCLPATREINTVSSIISICTPAYLTEIKINIDTGLTGV